MKTIVAIILVLVSVGSVVGQTATSSSTTFDRVKFDSLRAAGYEALYNLDYEGARRHFREMIKLAPDHPAGPQCYAASLWLQQLNESWELKATLYNAESYATGKSQANLKQSQEFREWTRRAKLLAEARLRRDRRDAEALYFLGAAEGLESAHAAAVERKFMIALRSGSDSVDHHREVLSLMAQYHDAELTIGLYNYIVGSLPLPLKMLVGTMGVRGSKKRGLETLERVATDGHWAKDVARVLLIDLYKREKRWTAAVLISRQLAERYPRNHLFKLQLADAQTTEILSLRKADKIHSDEEEAEVVGTFESLLQQKSNQSDTLSPATLDLIHFRYGETLLALSHPETATRQFQFVVNRSEAEPGLKAMCRLRVAQSLDITGKRTEALAEYRAVLGTPDINQSHEKARRGLREPFRGTDQPNRD